jgi:hypothetical protein
MLGLVAAFCAAAGTTSLAVAAGGQAQLGTGALAGAVLDSSDASVTGAHVMVTNTETGLVRTVATTGAGQFNIPVLPPGPYVAVIEHQGFARYEQHDLVVAVGATTTLKVKLQPAGVAESVSVTAAQPEIDSSKTSQSTLIDRTQINDLPINGRRADQFALLAPGVTRDGRFGLLSYRGQSGVFNNFTLEGNDDNQAYFSEARGRTRIASNVSANAIREFQVTQSGFMPEFGRSAGGGVNAVVRSGTNRPSADGFYYFRNKALNARDPLATINPDETRQQFGGSIGGPIVRDRLFYFFNIDQQLRDYPLIIEDLSGVLTSGLPANPTAGDLAAFNAGVTALRQQFPGGAPGHTIPRTNNQTLLLGKVDAQINASTLLSITHNYLYAHSDNGIQTPLVLGNVGRNGSDDVRIQSFNARLTSVLSSSTVNEMRFQAGRDFEFEFANQPPPQVFVGGFSFGRATFLERPALPDERKLQFVDNLSRTAGRHNLKVGIDLVHAKDIIDNPATFGGSYTYSNALTFGRDLLDPSGRNYTSFQQNFGLVGVNFSTIDLALFAQDAWHPTNRLTLNYGVRYDYQQNPSPVAPNPAIPETQAINSWKGGAGPRLGAAYDLTGDDKTVVRSAYGIYYGRTPNGVIENALAQTGLFDPAKNTVSLTLRGTDAIGPTYPNILPDLPAGAQGSATAFRLDTNYKPPRLNDFNVGLERELAPHLTLATSFIYTKGDRLPVAIDTNLPAPAFTRQYQFPDGSVVEVPFSAGVTRSAQGLTQNVNLSRPNPNFGALATTTSIGETWYRALFVELKRRFANGYQFGVAYTLAKAENLGGSANGAGAGSETPFGGGNLRNQFDLASNRGVAPTDQRHRLVFNGIANLPYRFRVSGIFTAESGRPYSTVISVPALPFAGADGTQYVGFGGLLGQGGGDDRNVAPNLPRNSTYGDANYRIDLRLARDFRIDRLFVEVLAEAFNVFNRSNYNGFQNVRYDAQATTVTTPLSQPVVLTERSTFGAPNNDGSQPDGTNARRIQVALRFRF